MRVGGVLNVQADNVLGDKVQDDNVRDDNVQDDKVRKRKSIDIAVWFFIHPR